MTFATNVCCTIHKFNVSGNDPPARFLWAVGVHFPGWKYRSFSGVFLILSMCRPDTDRAPDRALHQVEADHWSGERLAIFKRKRTLRKWVSLTQLLDWILTH